MTTAVMVGLGLATSGLVGRQIAKYAPQVVQNLEKKAANLPKAKFDFSSFNISDVKYYKGGFESKMTRREASLILGVR